MISSIPSLILLMDSESLEGIEDKLRSLVAAKLKLPPENVPMDAPIVAELGLDSIEVIQFMLEVEEVFPEFLLRLIGI